MSQITKPKAWADNENVTYTDLNNTFDTIYNDYNGSISNANISSSAAIVESKIAFDTSAGHDHDGVDSKAIPKALVFTITGTLTTGTSSAPVLVSTGSMTISKAYLNVKTAPTGQAIKVDVNKNGTSIWNTTQSNRVSVAAGATSGTQTSFDTSSLSEGDVITVDIDQVGSSNPGADLTITLKT